MQREMMDRAATILKGITANVEKVIRGQSNAIRKLLAGLATGGHILLEDNPGTGKTTLSKALALSIGADFKRIQFTPDLLPTDIIGVSIFDQGDGRFHFHRGPIFTNILLADEINRASPRTQAALLEAMAERQISTDGKVYSLDTVYFVLATQNPIESAGTYPLPEAQMDRFAMKLSLGYVPFDDEMRIMDDQRETHPLENLKPCATLEDIQTLQSAVKGVEISYDIKHYILELVRGTRDVPGVALGASPRAYLALMHIARAIALFNNRDFVIPEDVREVALDVLPHRLVIDSQTLFSGASVDGTVEELLKNIPSPE
jgi:MoxR-like ATPase